MFSYHATRIPFVEIFLGWNISHPPFSRHSGSSGWGGSEEVLLTRRTICAHGHLQWLPRLFYTTGQPICHTCKSNLYFLMKDSYCYFITTDFSPWHKWSNRTRQSLYWKMMIHLLDFHNIRYPPYWSFLDNPRVSSKVTHSVACHTNTHDLVSPKIHEDTIILCLAQNWCSVEDAPKESSELLYSPLQQTSCYFLKILLV